MTAIGNAVTGAAITATGTQVLTLPLTPTGAFSLTWTIGGTAGPSFAGVNATIETSGSPAGVMPKPTPERACRCVANAALDSSRQLKAGAGVLRSLFCRVDQTAPSLDYYLHVVDSATLPTDGAISTVLLAAPKKVHHTTGAGNDDEFTLDYAERARVQERVLGLPEFDRVHEDDRRHRVPLARR